MERKKKTQLNEWTKVSNSLSVEKIVLIWSTNSETKKKKERERNNDEQKWK